MKHEKYNSSLESEESVRTAANLVGIDTAQMTTAQISAAVIKAGEEIVSDREESLPANYRTIKSPPFVSPLALSVAVITIESLKK
jgi:hypothetical protein